MLLTRLLDIDYPEAGFFIFFMNDAKEKNFTWKEGEVLNEKNADALGGIRQYGLPKIKKSIAADPDKRKKDRDDYLEKKQSQTYKGSDNSTLGEQKKKFDDGIIAEDTGSVFSDSDKFEESEVKKLTDKGKKIKGIDRFRKK